MKLASLGLENFRQFYGRQELHFAAGDGDQNVTVVHGYNGSGKTALLNAFVWCMYGETTGDLEAPERLENERAIAEAGVGDSVDVVVRLTFDHQDTPYIIERKRTSIKEAGNRLVDGAVELKMWSKSAGGEISTVGLNADERQLLVRQWLPPSLYPFFFFNGERVERLASPAAYDEVESGVKTLLDVTIFERSVDHLGRVVETALARELRSHSDSELAEALDQQTALETRRRSLMEEVEEKHAEIKALDVEIDEYERKQSAIASLTALTERRKTLRAELESLEGEEGRIVRDLRRRLSKDGYLAFAEPVFVVAATVVDEARERGEIPAKIKPQFVDDLMDEAQCICGRPLVEGTSEWEALVKWRAATGLAELEETISQTAAMLGPLRQRGGGFCADVDRLQAERSRVLSGRRDTQKALAIVDQEIGDQKGEDAASLAARLGVLRRDLATRQSEKLLAERDLRLVEEEQQDLRERLKKLHAQGDRAQLLKRQTEAVQRVGDALQRVLDIRKDTARRVLDEQIGEIWRDAALKDYRASVSDNYRLVLTKKVGGIEQPVLGASTGEKQVLALSFVASLVRALEENAQDPEAWRHFGLVLGGVFPLVMDSPFGSLEDYYREKIAQWVPKLAHQVVVLVSSTQWRDEAERALAGRIGRSYILELHTTKENATRKLPLRGREYPYVVRSEDAYEFTAIREVP